jgi:hypothetical protein
MPRTQKELIEDLRLITEKFHGGPMRKKDRRKLMRNITVSMIAEDEQAKEAFESLRSRGFSQTEAIDNIACALLAVLWEAWNEKFPTPDPSDSKALEDWFKGEESRWNEVLRRIAGGEEYLDIWPDG